MFGVCSMLVCDIDFQRFGLQFWETGNLFLAVVTAKCSDSGTGKPTVQDHVRMCSSTWVVHYNGWCITMVSWTLTVSFVGAFAYPALGETLTRLIAPFMIEITQHWTSSGVSARRVSKWIGNVLSYSRLVCSLRNYFMIKEFTSFGELTAEM